MPLFLRLIQPLALHFLLFRGNLATATVIRLCAAAIWFSTLTIVSVGRSEGALTTQRTASGLDRPIYVTAPKGDSRLFIVEQRGVIKILENGIVLSTPFLDIDALVPQISGNDEHGLLGLVFHPDYPGNGYFYINYINLSNDSVIARYQVSGNRNVANPASAR